FREFQGIALSSLVVGDFRTLAVETVEFAAVELSSPQGSTEVVARRDEEGPWTVDMVATFGPALVRRLRGILDAAVDDPQGAVIRAGYVAAVLPGLEAATQLHEQDTLLQSELAAMHVLVGDQ
ncbi:MAG: hypothetical protein ACE5GC_06370, partial [Acidimicrobiia bacterium]